MHMPIPTPTRRGLLVLAFAALLTACGGNQPIEDDAGTLVGPTAADEPLPGAAEPAPVAAATVRQPGSVALGNPVGPPTADAAAAEAPAAQPGRRAASDRSALNVANTATAPTGTPTR